MAIALDPFNGTSSIAKKLSGTMNSLVLINDGTTDVTFKAGSFTHVVRAGEIFDEELNPFDTLDITASGPFHGYTRRNKDQYR